MKGDARKATCEAALLPVSAITGPSLTARAVSYERLLLLHSRKLQSLACPWKHWKGSFCPVFGSSFQFINTTGILGDSQSRFCFCHIQHIPIDTPLPHTLLKCNRMRRDAHPSPTFRTQLRRSRARATTQLTTAVLLLCPLLPASASHNLNLHVHRVLRPIGAGQK